MDRTDREIFDDVTGSIREELERRGRRVERRYGSAQYRYLLFGVPGAGLAVAVLGLINPFIGVGLFLVATIALATFTA
jgi:hypothetical protein